MHSALSRRALLASPLALSAYAATPAGVPAPPAVSGELSWMIDTYEEIAANRAVLVGEIMRISASPDQPPCAEVVTPCRYIGTPYRQRLEEEEFALFGKLSEIEKWLRAYTCRSLADVVAIAAFAETWLADDGTDMEARSDLLRAISAFAVATEER
ncbi:MULTISPECIES: hypothetical protein [unclassified Ensifer]|uniref:hypothetical protein n=1 Tax=unclassified Ensifer TaxID=2633371 RepID=UPI000713CC5C|nr:MULTISPECIES: hypothetical protein [unclassified Ensifer]KQX40895.1 hypothetical protein ASD49_15640 [Ensifer sp. Root1298]KQX70216.1 hypothetical protein ASD41_16715 [Ensifer sp. Root1312]KRC14456.1 hypothetical protein ASE29_17195 [Ensifer sp. Root74]